MATVLTVTNLQLVVVILLSLAVAVGAWRNRPARGSRTLAAFMLGVVLLVAAHLAAHVGSALLGEPLEAAVDTYAEKLRWLGFGSMPFLWVAFVLDYTGRDRLLARPWLAGLFLWPALLNAAVWLPDAAALVGVDPGGTAGVFESLHAEKGAVYWTHVLLSYALLAGGSLAVVAYVYRTNRLFRTQGAAILAGLGAVWVGSAVQVFDLLGDLHVHGLQAGFFVMGVALFWGVFRAGLTDVTPVARSTIVDNLTAGVLVVDDEGRITDANPAAGRILGGQQGTTAAGRPVREALADHPGLLETVRGERRSEDEVRIVTADGDRTLQVDVRPLQKRGDRIGKAVVLYDITEQKRRQEELDLTKRVFSRVLRHNIRNDLNAVMGYADLITRGGIEGNDRMARSIFEITSALVETSEKAREIERILELDDPGTELDVVEAVRKAVEAVRGEYPDVEFRTDLPAGARAFAHVDLRLAVENLVENAAVHNDAADPRVRVAVGADDGGVRITVEDNGPGIPEEEVAAVTSGTEAPLQHASGVGLHLVNWIVRAADGDLDFTDTPEGTRVTVSLRPASSEGAATGAGVEGVA